MRKMVKISGLLHINIKIYIERFVPVMDGPNDFLGLGKPNSSRWFGQVLSSWFGQVLHHIHNPPQTQGASQTTNLSAQILSFTVWWTFQPRGRAPEMTFLSIGLPVLGSSYMQEKELYHCTAGCEGYPEIPDPYKLFWNYSWGDTDHALQPEENIY